MTPRKRRPSGLVLGVLLSLPLWIILASTLVAALALREYLNDRTDPPVITREK